MSVLLDLGYLVVLLLTLPWLLLRRTLVGGWHGLRSRLGFDLGLPMQDVIWLHGSSAGEISLLKPLIDLLERNLPDSPLLISAYSTTGLAAARKAYPTHRSIYFPLDFSFVVRRMFRHFSPRLIVIVESELWPNFLMAADRQDIPVAVVNGKMSEKSFRLHARTGLVPMLLRRLPLLAVQSEEHAQRLRALGVEPGRVEVTGNMKYDTARQLPASLRADLRRALGYGQDDAVLLGGSLHTGEDELVLDVYAELASVRPLALIVAPRYPRDADRVLRLAATRGLSALRKTELAPGAPVPRGAVLVVDTMGELTALYAVADVAFVGGSLYYRGSNKGGHNLMEPAAQGIPVLFGPYNFSFKEIAEDLLQAGAARLVCDAAELGAAVTELLDDADRRQAMGAAAQRVVTGGQGAAARNYALIRAMLRSSVTSTHNAAISD